ncbi:Mitochondrial import inner membrane translocase subunit TIM17 [Metarhizium acridum CQMa 102]|uniref:Mitochondrial import inner membrane translocase subunit TIM17 n=1 Tax=Metarhizium acridum (strain CQMa 102) TaxID=655827 RepID=E9E0H6_METAQ|nr:Mitochondrial import inner membrane translocase subunit TIM17 [Metarhizium acridum CQMa 102]EFY90596.1 Mitochondrial import inner membrane translocase subunit TIM17 [Metarhizium acridum CQMa 102]
MDADNLQNNSLPAQNPPPTRLTSRAARSNRHRNQQLSLLPLRVYSAIYPEFAAKRISQFGIYSAIGGTIWHGVKGFRNSPYGERRIGAITAIKMRAPVLGGNFGVWGGLFSTYDCAIKGIRKKEDPYNAIIAGFFVGGSLAFRGGFKAARNNAIGCAVLLAVIEGVGIAFSKMLSGGTKLEMPQPPPSMEKASL